MKSVYYHLLLLAGMLCAASGLTRPICPPQDGQRQSLTSVKADTEHQPYETVAVHNVGKLAMTLTNYGVFGSGSYTPLVDPLTGLEAPSLEYPQNKNVNYLFQMQLWVGALVGKDTLVSTAGGEVYAVSREFWPDSFPSGDIVYRSISNPNAPEFDSAISQQDFIAYYMDTIIDPNLTHHDHYTNRYHQAIGVKVTQRSYAWGYDYAEDFLLVDLDVANITFRNISNVYIGLYVDNDIGKTTHDSYGNDDWAGFKKTTPSKYIAGLIDTINCAWTADNNGEPDPVSGQFQGLNSPTSIAAISILRTPRKNDDFNFNWWAASWYQNYNWGPMKAPAEGEPVHTFFGDYGSPHSDGDKYYMMANDEFDYDSWECQYDHTSQGWLPPPPNSWGIHNGADVHYLISCGPYSIGPGQSIPLTFAVVMGQHFHRDGVIAPYPTRNFSDLELNALWASWVYDNPGVDTDGDGYRGECHVYGIGGHSAKPYPYDPQEPASEYEYVDTLWYRGDGVPDFSGAAPPPAPEFSLDAWINDKNQGIIDIYWDGMTTENTRDQFNQSIDFEGYRVYLSITGMAGDFDLVSSYDMDNYDRWEFDDDYEEWGIVYAPFTRAQLQGWYGENFDPDKFYDIDNLFPFYNIRTGQDEFFYFTRHDWNQSSLTDTTLIHKLYPLEPPPPTLDYDSARIYYPDVLTEDGKFKYYQYHYRLRRLLPSQPYYVSVTAFDHGDPAKNLTPRETPPYTNAQREFAQNSAAKVEAEGLNVVVYPNPYRIDGRYREHFEGWEQPDLPAERTRAIHFANLPHKCVIRIFTIDGDLIREIFHDYPQGAPGSSHDQWDMISRNTMTVMSGIYYYVVDSDMGKQIGKLVIIM
ncbi:MAG: hypothetical protein JW763_04730 [candidate division Zixibacteria bacterium]|nr:hypothetical protein [candidate division Zixibacteria bacterium]